ncbi:Regulation of nuclear pre-mRNA domain-containing protein 2 [Homalodisca vitripennis]|nr:Regulation of nuclear pre-mRNA domain-containing protein 2 [Homalodisca vitripennis]
MLLSHPMMVNISPITSTESVNITIVQMISNTQYGPGAVFDGVDSGSTVQAWDPLSDSRVSFDEGLTRDRHTHSTALERMFEILSNLLLIFTALAVRCANVMEATPERRISAGRKINARPGKYSTASSFIGTLVVPEHIQLSNHSDDLYTRAKDSPPRKISYKPPTPPRSYKRKSSPKSYHSPPPTTYISSTTPTLSSSSPSNYSSSSPYQPVTKSNSYTSNTTSYSIPSVAFSHNEGLTYPPTTTYSATNEPYSDMYNPEDNEQMAFNDPPDSYHIPGANPPPPPPMSYTNPPPSSNTYSSTGRNPSPEITYDLTSSSSPAYQSSTPYNSRKFQSSRSYDNPPPVVAPPPDYSVPPPPVNEYNPTLRPFYSSSNNLTMPPLLGEDCPPSAINGLDSFLQGDSVNDDSPNAPPLLGSGFSSFMGNINLPFDFQKGLFSEVSCDDTPASPPGNVLDDSTSQIEYFSDSNHDVEGKPIEVINRTKQPDLSELLKVISMQGVAKGGVELPPPSPSVPPPPLPPTVLDDYPSEPEDHDKPWSQPPLLPPKFPTWGHDDWSDTPASPPLYEKSGFSELIEFEEGDSLALGDTDTDLRSLGLQGDIDHRNLISLSSLQVQFSEPIEFEEGDSLALGDTDTDLRSLGLQGDIDHRNLISLTSSPRDEAVWSSTTDTDYRKLVLAPKRGAQDDNVESVDMEMSSEEETEAEVLKPAVSFSLTPQIKPLAESPLVEKEEPKVKKLLNIAISPPPRLPEPPPLPNVNDIFPELDSGGEADEIMDKIPSPPVPPLPPPMPIPPLQTGQEVPVINPSGGYHPQRPPRGFFSPRFNNQRQRYPQWQANPNNNMRPRPPPMSGPRFRPDNNFRGRPPWYRGNNRPPRFGGW